MRLRSIAPLAAAAATVCACGGNGSLGKLVSAACSSVAPPVLLYPAPLSSAIPDGNFSIGAGYAHDPSVEFSAPSLSAAGAQPISGAAWSQPSPGPTNPPGFNQLPAGDSYWQSAVPALAAKTTYTVSVTNFACGPVTLGTFTTQ